MHWIVLEFLEGGDLLNYLEKHKSNPAIDKLIEIAEDVKTIIKATDE